MDNQNNGSIFAPTRRKFLAGAGAVSAAALVSGCSSGGTINAGGSSPSPTYPALTITDNDILNFALNLEYLEAEFYLQATTGTGVPTADAGSGAGAVTGGTQVTFANGVQQQLFIEIAQDELNHIRVLRAAISGNNGSPISRPAIDFTAGFAGIATAAGITAGLNPFMDGNSFTVGAFSFIDVGVSAYTGAAPLINSSTILDAAAGIQAAEAYHSGAVRSMIAGMASGSGNTTYLDLANKVAQVRASLGGGKENTLSLTSIVYADANAIGFARSTSEVLHIVYGTPNGAGVAKGGFFPNGVNGSIYTTAS